MAAGPRRPAGLSRRSEEYAVAAGRSLPVTGPADHAAALRRLAGLDNCPAHWSEVLRRAADTIALRRAFLEETR